MAPEEGVHQAGDQLAHGAARRAAEPRPGGRARVDGRVRTAALVATATARVREWACRPSAGWRARPKNVTLGDRRELTCHETRRAAEQRDNGCVRATGVSRSSAVGRTT